ncbi:MAG: hypothetical protein L3J05_05435 [Robiginitomaculum sp.]|nr:hypothetical protein [Robiginitomaculum sp.]
MYEPIYPIALRAFALATVLTLAACKTTEPPAPAPVLEPTPAPAPIVAPTKPAPPPPLFIPARPTAERIDEPLVRAAGNYAVLMNQVNLIAAASLRSSAHLNQTMDGLTQVYSPSLGPALLGYGALIGAQQPEFVEGVIETARSQGIDSVVYQLYVDPDYAASLSGAPYAAAQIQNAWASDIAAVSRASEHIKSQSYSLQKQKQWKKMRADSRSDRLEVLSRSKSTRFNPPHATTEKIAIIGTIRASDAGGDQKRQQFWQVYGRNSPPRTQTFRSQYKGEMHRKALTLSALEILGATSSESTQWIENYMTSPGLTQCVNTARLNTEQCIAAGHFKYEDAFCMAEHQLKEISNCLSASTL